MSSLFVYDVNTYLKADSELQSLMGSNDFNIFPAVAPDETKAPMILWTLRSNIRSPELPYFRIDEFCYHVYDTDADRCLQIGERIISILSISDKINKIPSYRSGKWCYLRKGNFSGPSEREGWYMYILDFEAAHLPA